MSVSPNQPAYILENDGWATHAAQGFLEIAEPSLKLSLQTVLMRAEYSVNQAELPVIS